MSNDEKIAKALLSPVAREALAAWLRGDLWTAVQEAAELHQLLAERYEEATGCKP